MGALLVFVDVVKELPLTFALRPFDFDTLSVRVFQYASDERVGAALIPALLILGLGLAASLALVPSLERRGGAESNRQRKRTGPVQGHNTAGSPGASSLPAAAAAAAPPLRALLLLAALLLAGLQGGRGEAGAGGGDQNVWETGRLNHRTLKTGEGVTCHRN